jgi:VanZ family protein
MRVKDLTRFFSSITVRWLMFGLWTVLVFYLLLWPSNGTPVHDVSSFFGGTELTDAGGHVVLAFVEALLLYRVLCYYMPVQRATLWTLGCTLLLGLALESAQYWIPSRGATLLDLGANWLGVGISVIFSKKVFPTG